LLEVLPEASFRRRKAAASCRTPKPAEARVRREERCMGAKLQLALDFVELEEALGLLEKVHSFVDIVERRRMSEDVFYIFPRIFAHARPKYS
jgi:hypothetical protein